MRFFIYFLIGDIFRVSDVIFRNVFECLLILGDCLGN